MKMAKVELIFDTACPNVEAARIHLRTAFEKLDIRSGWLEWERNDLASPDYVKNYGSPTILVDGVDISGEGATSDGNSCRVYLGESNRLSGVPSIETIVRQLAQSSKVGTPRLPIADKRGEVKRMAAAILAAVISLLPAVSCPACWAGYAALLSSLGVGFFNYSPYLFPVMLFLLTLNIIFLALEGRRRQQYEAFALGIGASVMMILGKFVFDMVWLLYIGAGLLVIASLLNLYLNSRKTVCCQCTEIS